jgi:hypothetical protein
MCWLTDMVTPRRRQHDFDSTRQASTAAITGVLTRKRLETFRQINTSTLQGKIQYLNKVLSSTNPTIDVEINKGVLQVTVQMTVHFSFAFQSFLGVLFGVGAKLGFVTFSGVLLLEYRTANELRNKNILRYEGADQ